MNARKQKKIRRTLELFEPFVLRPEHHENWPTNFACKHFYTWFNDSGECFPECNSIRRQEEFVAVLACCINLVRSVVLFFEGGIFRSIFTSSSPTDRRAANGTSNGQRGYLPFFGVIMVWVGVVKRPVSGPKKPPSHVKWELETSKTVSWWRWKLRKIGEFGTPIRLSWV